MHPHRGGGHRAARVETVSTRQRSLFGEEETRPTVSGHVSVYIGEVINLKAAPPHTHSSTPPSPSSPSPPSPPATPTSPISPTSPTPSEQHLPRVSSLRSLSSHASHASHASSSARPSSPPPSLPPKDDPLGGFSAGYVRIGIRNLVKRTRVLPLHPDGTPTMWDQVKHIPLIVPRSSVHPFGLVSFTLFGQRSHSNTNTNTTNTNEVSPEGGEGNGVGDEELGSVYFRLHDVIKAQRFAGWFPLRLAHFVVGSLYLEVTFSYGLFGYGYSPQVVVSSSSRTGDAAIRTSLLPRVEPPPARSEGAGRATLVPSAVLTPSILPVTEAAQLGYASEMASDLQAAARNGNAPKVFPRVAQGMTRLSHLTAALAAAPSRQDRLSFLHAVITAPAVQPEAASAALVDAAEGGSRDGPVPGAEQTSSFHDYFKPTFTAQDRDAYRRSDSSIGGGGGGGDGGGSRTGVMQKGGSFHGPGSSRPPMLGDAVGRSGSGLWGRSDGSVLAASAARGNGDARDEAGRSTDRGLRVLIPTDSGRIVHAPVPSSSPPPGAGGEEERPLAPVFSNDLLPRNKVALAAAVRTAVAMASSPHPTSSASGVGSGAGTSSGPRKGGGGPDRNDRSDPVVPSPLSPRGMSARQRAASSRQLMQMASGQYSSQRRSSVSISAERDVIASQRGDDRSFA